MKGNWFAKVSDMKTDAGKCYVRIEPRWWVRVLISMFHVVKAAQKTIKKIKKYRHDRRMVDVSFKAIEDNFSLGTLREFIKAREEDRARGWLRH